MIFSRRSPLQFDIPNLPNEILSMRSIFTIRRWLPLVLAVFVVVSAGCAARGKVTGKVTYKGKAMPGGSVVFIGSGGVPSGSADIDPANGTYSIELPVGERKVAVTPFPKMNATGGKGGADAKGKAYGPPKDSGAPPDVSKAFERKETGAKHVPIPEQYKDAEKSGLKVSVKGGSTPFDIDIP